MNTENSLKLLIDAVNLAQSRGAYNLKESATILGAVETFTNNQNNTMNDDQTNPATPVEESVETTPEVVETAVESEGVTPEEAAA